MDKKNEARKNRPLYLTNKEYEVGKRKADKLGVDFSVFARMCVLKGS